MLQFLKKSLKPYNTFQLDVTAEKVIELTETSEIAEIFANLNQSGEKFIILGGGSNVLFSGDYNGTVLINRLKGIQVVTEEEDHFLITAASGEFWDDFVETAVTNGWFGLENLSLIPGTVGAAPIQNIGAYGQEAANLIQSVTYYDIIDGEFKTLVNQDCKFGYRNSIFKHSLKNRAFITDVTFRLSRKFTPLLGYKDVSARFEGQSASEVTARQVRDAVIEIRKAKLPDPAELGNAGSFFKNPEIPTADFNGLKSEYAGLPGYPSGDSVKIPAGWLIQESGWKGKRHKNCGTYPNQALVLVNYGGAHPSELLELKEMIKASVKEKFSVSLEEEVNIIN